MPNTARRYTVDEVLVFPNDGNRYELVHGELLVTPAPSQRHQGVVTDLCARLATYLAEHRAVARLFVGPADIIWGPDEYVQPDLLVVPAGEVTSDWRDCRTLLLAIEVVSPSSARGDRLTKRALYQRQGVGTYWIVDADAQVVEVWHPSDERPEIVAGILRWRVAPDATDLTIDLPEFYAHLPA